MESRKGNVQNKNINIQKNKNDSRRGLSLNN